MNLLLLVHEQNGCDYHRTMLPFRYLDMENGERFKYISYGENIKVDDIVSCDIMMFNRNPSHNINDIEQTKKRFGYKLWVDLDDTWLLYPHHILYDSYVKAGTKHKMIKCMQMADVVTVTNPRLLLKVRKLLSQTKEKPIVEVIPNSLPFGYEQFKPAKTQSHLLRFIVAGGSSHYDDLKSIEQPLKWICKDERLKRNTGFVLAGYEPTHANSIWFKINDLMKDLPNYSTRGQLDLNHYMEHYNYADVAMAPLENNRFNQYKSNLKTVEAGCMGLPIIVPAQYPYIEDISMKDKGIKFCTSSQDWIDAVKVFEASPNMVEDYGSALKEYVTEKYNLLKVNNLRRQIINYLKN